MSTVNTGNVIVVRLRRLRTDITNPSDPNYRAPVDSDSVPVSVSGNPPDLKANTQGDPNYIAPYPNLTECPV
jgi:hypothetical protein